jgi:F-type H+-transporting ATPase subunit c
LKTIRRSINQQPATSDQQPATDFPTRKELNMDSLGWVAVASIFSAGICIGIGAIGPALGEGRALAQALSAIAQQPDEVNTITRTLFVGLAMVESTAIYCFVVSMILIFANPFWRFFLGQGGAGG